MIVLNSTLESIDIVKSDAISVSVTCSFSDITDDEATDGNSLATITATSPVVAAPASLSQRQVHGISIVNIGSSPASLTPNIVEDGDYYPLFSTVNLLPGESLQYSSAGWQVFNINGLPKQTNSLASLGGRNYDFIKVGGTAEAAGVHHGLMFGSGSPGAFTIGTPGLSGRTITSSTEPGRIPVLNAVSGKNYIASFNITTSVACMAKIIDLLWINSGIAVTTTTAQTINSLTLPSRDLNASSAGLGCYAAILVQTATTNASAVTTITMSFTDSNGVSGKTATVPSFPATAALGTIVPFYFPAGVEGIESIQTLTLGTSLGGGAVSLIIYRPVLTQTCLLANIGNDSVALEPGIAIENNVCLLPIYLASVTTATALYGSLNVMERG